MKVTSLEAGRARNWRRAGGCDVSLVWDEAICDGERGKETERVKSG